jgi:hypothetical protein
MKKQITSVALCAVLALFISSAIAQPGLQWTRTLQLEGAWEGNVTLVLGADTFPLIYYMDFKTGIDGNALTMDEGFTDPLLGELKGLNLIGFNAADELIHWFSADNFGTAHEHIGAWQTQKRLHMEHRIDQAGQPFVELIDLKLKANNNKLDVNLVATLGSDTVQVLEGTLLRQNGNNNRLISGEEEESITVYPNPASGELTISGADVIDEIIITNESGQQVYKATPGTDSHTLKLLAAGIYFLRITSGATTETKKAIIVE